MKEKLTRVSEVRHWEDVIPVMYRYTAGAAGDRFLRELRDNQRIIASKCGNCGKRHLPPRSFCPHCFREISEFETVVGTSKLHSYGVSYTSGRKNIIGIMKFEGVDGGLLHRIGEADLAELKIGMELSPVFRRDGERKGSIEDIAYFRPKSRER